MELLVILAFVGSLVCTGAAQNFSACDSEVFCRGQLLHTIQMSGIFNDSKEFVDRPLRADPQTVLEAFRNLTDNSSDVLLAFVEEWTEEAGQDVKAWFPPDWVERPSFMEAIKNSSLQQWALELNALWRQLGREVNSSVAENPDRHSLIPVPNPFIVPGGRFREFYYWDSYWVIKGLLLCEMNDTARDMIENMAYLLEQYGLVPNGGRVYYTRRSQPPLLTQMVDLYYNATGDIAFLDRMLPALVKEYDFWMENRAVEVQTFTLNQYSAPTDEPRPESYREDWQTAEAVSQASRPTLYSNIASGAETGWDFSSRWFARSGPHADQLASIRTKRIIPVDLNTILCQNEATLVELFKAVGNMTAAEHFNSSLKNRQEAFDSVFWNETEGLWLDWDLDQQTHLDGFYASSLLPLLWGCSSSAPNVTRHKIVLSKLQELGVLDYPGGIPTSLYTNSTQQWDFPNVWAPLQWFPVVGWHTSDEAALRETARDIAEKWIATTFTAWGNFNKIMFEKYDCREVGVPGSGGEYEIQAGFGWTNAVVLHFLALYPDLDTQPLTSPAPSGTSTPSSPTPTSSSTPTPSSPTPTPSSPTSEIQAVASPAPSGTPTPTPSSPASSRQSLSWIAAVVILTLSIGVAIPCVVWCRWVYRRGRDRYWARVRNEHLMAASGGRSSPPLSPTVYINKYTDSPDGRVNSVNKTFQFEEFDV